MRFSYRKGFFEADLIVKERVTLPDGWNPQTTRLELATEFTQAPAPDATQCAFASSDGATLVDDALIDFGGMMMVPGKAFSINGTQDALTGPKNNALHVLKRWQKMNGRQFLIESVAWTEAERHMQSLPKASGIERKPFREAGVGRDLPTTRMAVKNPEPVRVARLPYNEEGFVIDYITVVTQPTWTFQSGQTYLVPNSVSISSSCTFQAGAIIKFDRLGAIMLSGTISCPPDGSVFLTARDDTSIGEDTSTGALTGYYGNPYYLQLYNMNAAVLNRMNIRYAREGVFANTPCYSAPQTVRDSRFEDCEKGVTASISTMTLTNLIFCNTPTQYYNYGGSSFSVSAVTSNCNGYVRFTTLTDGKVLSGITNLPIEIVSGDKAFEAISLNDGGDPVKGLAFNSSYSTATWDTAGTTNGQYTLTPVLYFTDDVVVFGPTNTVTVTNYVWFPNYYPVAGNALRVEVQTIHANGTWSMNVYDDQNNLRSVLNGTVDENGNCNLDGFPGPGFSLSLLDGNGEQLPEAFWVLAITTFAAAGQRPPTATGRQTNFVERSWWGQQTWFNVTYQQIYQPSSFNGQNLKQMLVDVYLAAKSRYPTLSQAVQLGTETEPWRLLGPSEWSTLAVSLTNDFGTRNLYYFGHGSAERFGYSDDTNQQINIPDLNRILKNALDPLKGTNGHPYRFVFLDGCKTANGGLASAFGIPKGNVPMNEFIGKRGIRPRAFLGWDKNCTIGWGAFDQQHNTFIGSFFDKWRNAVDEQGLPYGVQRAITEANPVSWSQRPHLTVHGYSGLFFIDD